MLFEKYLLPDRMADTFRDVTPEFLTARGIRGLICDIDNTLAPYEDLDAPADVVAWCSAMRAAGVQLAFVSNNHAERVHRFNEAIGALAFPDSSKPGTKDVLRAMAAMGTDAASTALLGDQLLTDCAAGKRCGLYVVIVPPIRDKRTLFFRFKRALEKPYVRLYARRRRPESQTTGGHS